MYSSIEIFPVFRTAAGFEFPVRSEETEWISTKEEDVDSEILCVANTGTEDPPPYSCGTRQYG